jgi:pimeloyl-ACP methyl ester carboxylesterase
VAFAWNSTGGLRYAEAGTGTAPALVVIDGQGGRRPGRAQDLLAEERRVLFFSLPDAGGVDEAAGRIGAALDGLGIGAFDVMGHGAGASVALALAFQRKDGVRSVVLAAPLALDAAGTPPEFLEEVSQPVLALFGTNDAKAPPESGDRYRARLKDCNLMFVYDAAHELDLDRPEAVAFIVGEFLGRHDQFLVSREDGRAFP